MGEGGTSSGLLCPAADSRADAGATPVPSRGGPRSTNGKDRLAADPHGRRFGIYLAPRQERTPVTAPRGLLPVLMIPTLGLVLTGCAERMSIIRKHAVDLKTTALFKRPCDADVPMAEYETMLNRCNRTRLSRMIEQFETIQEMEAARGIPGDTIEEVRAKGFSIYEDANPKLRRPNTLVLYGNDALAAVGMGVSAPPLQKPEEIKAYADFMAVHYAEQYIERDVVLVVDRFCVNNRESIEVGEDRVFTILWREARVLKRVIKGGPINNPKRERGLLLCPSGFLVD